MRYTPAVRFGPSVCPRRSIPCTVLQARAQMRMHLKPPAFYYRGRAIYVTSACSLQTREASLHQPSSQLGRSKRMRLLRSDGRGCVGHILEANSHDEPAIRSCWGRPRWGSLANLNSKYGRSTIKWLRQTSQCPRLKCHSQGTASMTCVAVRVTQDPCKLGSLVAPRLHHQAFDTPLLP